ncbi:MAG: Hsp20 family protein [Blastocatellia bacterium]|nr:Hsp20 family protein [Blastocatellia bacterium]
MSTQPAIKAQSGTLPIKIDTGETKTLFDRAKGLYESVAGRAYEFFDGRGREDGHDLEDWLRAERELLLPVPLKVTEYDDHLTVSAEVPGFSEKDLQVSLEPRRLIISGHIEQSVEEKTEEAVYASRKSKEIFHALDLPGEVDPARAAATLENGILDIRLPRAAQAEPARVEVNVK